MSEQSENAKRDIAKMRELLEMRYPGQKYNGEIINRGKHTEMKKICCVLLVLLITFTVIGSFADHFTPSYTTYDTTYEDILRMYLRVINAYGSKNVKHHDLFNDAIYGRIDPLDCPTDLYISSIKKNVGYMIYDVNQDGVDELLIGSNGGDINSVFTMDNGRVRELIRAGGYGVASSNYTCSLLVDGSFFRYGHSGALLDYYEIWQMNGTGPVSFVGGYHTDGVWDAASQTEKVVWYRSSTPRGKLTSSSSAKVASSVAEKWVRTQEENVYTKKFVPFSILEKYPDDPWNIAVLSVKGSTSSTAKVNVRKEADDKSKLVASKNVGTYVRVLSKEDGYFKIAFGNKEGYIKQEYLTPLTYRIPEDSYASAADEGTPAAQEIANQDEQDRFPLNGKTNSNSVNVRAETNKKSKLVVTIKGKSSSVTVKGETVDDDGAAWYEIEYKGKEGYVRSDFIDLVEPAAADSNQDQELYGLVIKKLATRSGPSPRAEDTGTYSLKGKRIRVYSRAYDPIENAWWVKCDVPYHGKIRTLWAWYTRFDSKTLPLEYIPIEDNVLFDNSNGTTDNTGAGGYTDRSFGSAAQDKTSSDPEEYDSVTDREASMFTGTLRVGSEGNAVFTLKDRLFSLQYYEGYIDEVFDDYTRTAVIKFQKENGLTADGVVGKETWTLLLSSKAKPRPTPDAEYIDVIDHYEDVEVQKTREVWDHDEYGMMDDGNGGYVEVAYPVYRTEYYIEIEQRPVYRQELKENVSPSDND